MSEWIGVLDDDIEVDKENKEVDLLVSTNSLGNVYVWLSFEQIERIYNLLPNDPECSVCRRRHGIEIKHECE